MVNMMTNDSPRPSPGPRRSTGGGSSGERERERRSSGEGEASRGERRSSTRRSSGQSTPGRTRRAAAAAAADSRRMSASSVETPSGGGGGGTNRVLERRASRMSADRAFLAVQRSDSDKQERSSPCPSRRSSQSQGSLHGGGSPRVERSPKRRPSQHSMRKSSGSTNSSPCDSPKRRQSQRHSSHGHHHRHGREHREHREHGDKPSRSGSLKAGTPGSTSSSITLTSSDPPTSKTHLLKQNALAARGMSVEEIEAASGEAGEEGGAGENLGRPAAEMAVAGLVMIAGTGALVVSFATGGTTWTIVGSTCMGLGALFLVIGICWYLSKTKTEEEEVEIRVVDAKQLAALIKQGMIVKPVNEV